VAHCQRLAQACVLYVGGTRDSRLLCQVTLQLEPSVMVHTPAPRQCLVNMSCIYTRMQHAVRTLCCQLGTFESARAHTGSMRHCTATATAIAPSSAAAGPHTINTAQLVSQQQRRRSSKLPQQHILHSGVNCGLGACQPALDSERTTAKQRPSIAGPVLLGRNSCSCRCCCIAVYCQEWAVHWSGVAILRLCSSPTMAGTETPLFLPRYPLPCQESVDNSSNSHRRRHRHSSRRCCCTFKCYRCCCCHGAAGGSVNL